jgi:hypothetical protein
MPSFENDGPVSAALVFATEPMFTGADHGPLSVLRVATQMS